MSKEVTNDELQKHKTNAIQKIEILIDNFAKISNSKADVFCYWLEDYSKFLNYEKKFNPKKLKRYKRGDIIKAHLGFNVGSEEGGLHYCIVLDKNNNLSSPIITVVPLTSKKEDDKRLRTGEIDIGNEIYTSINNKINSKYSAISAELSSLEDRSKSGETLPKNELNNIRRQIDDLIHMQSEFDGMKQGSIALVGQITTISKIRIYTPKTTHETLSGIKVSNTTLDKIDCEMKTLFMK